MVENFKDGSVHFIDLNVTDIFCKDTHTGQYTHFSTFEPLGHKTAWIKSLFCWAVMICGEPFLLNNQITNITKFMSWNSFPANIRKSIISKLKNKRLSGISKPVTEPDDTLPKIWFHVPYLYKTCIKKIRLNLDKPVQFIVFYQTK